jgi:hypothetical protein
MNRSASGGSLVFDLTSRAEGAPELADDRHREVVVGVGVGVRDLRTQVHGVVDPVAGASGGSVEPPR